MAAVGEPELGSPERLFLRHQSHRRRVGESKWASSRRTEQSARLQSQRVSKWQSAKSQLKPMFSSAQAKAKALLAAKELLGAYHRVKKRLSPSSGDGIARLESAPKPAWLVKQLARNTGVRSGEYDTLSEGDSPNSAAGAAHGAVALPRPSGLSVDTSPHDNTDAGGAMSGPPVGDDGLVEDDLHASTRDVIERYAWCHTGSKTTPGGPRQSPSSAGALSPASGVDGVAVDASGGHDLSHAPSLAAARARGTSLGSCSSGGTPLARPKKASKGADSTGWWAAQNKEKMVLSVFTKLHARRMMENFKDRQVEKAIRGRVGREAQLAVEDAKAQYSGKLEHTPPLVFHPKHPLRLAWTLFMALCVVLVLYITPLEIAFRPLDDTSSGWDIINWAMVVVFAADIAVTFRTAYYTDGHFEKDPTVIFWNYLQGWFAMDLIATFPFDVVVLLALGPTSPNDRALTHFPRFVRFLRLIRLTRMLRVYDARQMTSVLSEAGMFATWLGRMSGIAFWVSLIGHCIACGWYFLAELDGLAPGTWAYDCDVRPETPLGTKYIISLYFAFTTVTTIGYGDVRPAVHGTGEMVYVILCTFAGNAAFAVIISRMVSTNRTSKSFTLKINAVNALMESKGVPKSLRERVRRYYDEIWARRQPYSEDEILNSMHSALRRDILRAMYSHLLENVPFFQDSDPRFIDLLLERLRLQTCLPGDFVICEGDTGDCMYLLRKGTLAVIKDKRISHELTPGAFLGEACVLFSHVRRGATVMATTVCELMQLSAQAVDDVSEEFPDFRALIYAMALSRGADLSSVRFQPDDPSVAKALGDQLVTLLTSEFGSSVLDDRTEHLVKEREVNTLNRQFRQVYTEGSAPLWRRVLSKKLVEAGNPQFRVNVPAALPGINPVMRQKLHKAAQKNTSPTAAPHLQGQVLQNIERKVQDTANLLVKRPVLQAKAAVLGAKKAQQATPPVTFKVSQDSLSLGSFSPLSAKSSQRSSPEPLAVSSSQRLPSYFNLRSGFSRLDALIEEVGLDGSQETEEAKDPHNGGVVRGSVMGPSTVSVVENDPAHDVAVAAPRPGSAVSHHATNPAERVEVLRRKIHDMELAVRRRMTLLEVVLRRVQCIRATSSGGTSQAGPHSVNRGARASDTSSLGQA